MLAITLNFHNFTLFEIQLIAPFALLRPASSSAHGASSAAAPSSRASARVDGRERRQGPDNDSVGVADEGAYDNVTDAEPGHGVRGEGRDDNDNGCRDGRGSRGDKGTDDDDIVGVASC